jgi:hypothetical protein
MKKSIFSTISTTLLTGIIALSSSAFAAGISLYDQPNAKANVVGSVDLSKGIIPIYTPKPGDWVKIADPQNGNVGWVKSADLGKAMGNGSGAVTFTQKIMNDGKGQHTYQVIQYGSLPASSDKQAKMMIQNMQQQQATQQQVQKAIETMITQMNTLYQQQWNTFHTGTAMPIIMPVMVIPAQPNQTVPKK